MAATVPGVFRPPNIEGRRENAADTVRIGHRERIPGRCAGRTRNSAGGVAARCAMPFIRGVVVWLGILGRVVWTAARVAIPALTGAAIDEGIVPASSTSRSGSC